MTSMDDAVFKNDQLWETQCKAQSTLNKNFVTSYGKKIIEIKERMEVYVYECIHMHTNRHKDLRIYVYVFIFQSNKREKSRSVLSAPATFNPSGVRLNNFHIQ